MECPNREAAYEAEVALHEFFDVDVNPHFANKIKQPGKGFSFDYTGLKRPPKTKEHIENHKKALLGQKWFHLFLNDGTYITRRFKDTPKGDWITGRGPKLKTQDRKDLKWFHKVKSDGTIERKLL